VLCTIIHSTLTGVAALNFYLKPGADSRQRIVTITAQGRAKADAAYRAWHRAHTEFETLTGRDAVRVLHHQLEATLSRLTVLLEDAGHAGR
jgi:DNA-binding MarR family transcriptional regulator